MIPRPGPGALAVVCLALVSPLADDLAAQGLGGGIRGGLGIDRTGRAVYGGQIELVEFGRSSSVELALTGAHAGQIEEYTRVNRASRPHDYHEETKALAIGLVASWLIHRSQQMRGPYFVLGLGLTAYHVDWRIESPTDLRLGTPLPTGGSYDEEKAFTFGSMVNAGVGLRIHEHLDVRVQTLTMLVPSTDRREDMKLLPALTLAAGFGL